MSEEKATYPKITFRDFVTQNPFVLLLQKFVGVFPLSQWDCEWKDFPAVRKFLEGHPEIDCQTVLQQIEASDPSMVGLRSYLCLCFCQLDTRCTRSFGSNYTIIYWVFANFMLVLTQEADSLKFSENAFAAVNLVQEGQKIKKRYFERYANGEPCNPYSK